MQTNNLAFAVLERARQQPGKTAFIVSGRAIPYARVADLTVHFAYRMQQLGITRQSVVGLAIKDTATAVISALALALIGGRWVPVSTTSPSVYGAATHVLAAGAAARLPGRIEIGKDWFDAPPLSGDVPFPGHASPDDTWMIAHSSGTTGKPKFMPLTYGTIWRRFQNAELQDGVAPTTFNLFAPTSYVGSKIGIGNLILGGTNVAPAPFEELVRMGVTRVMGSPAQISAAIFDKATPADRRIRSLKVTGAQVTQKFVDTALRYFEELYVLYGATELGVGTLQHLTSPDQFDGTAGVAYDDAAVQIVDDGAGPVPVGAEGTVRVRSAWMVPGYLDEPALTAEFFRDGWFYPGDLGSLDAAGRLHITGRVNDVLNAGGMKLNATELDEVIQLHPDVADGYCFMLPNAGGVDTLCAMVALRPGRDPAGIETLRSMATAKLGRSRAPRRVYVTEAVPRNESGKPLRAAAAQLAARLNAIELSA